MYTLDEFSKEIEYLFRMYLFKDETSICYKLYVIYFNSYRNSYVGRIQNAKRIFLD